MAVNRRKIAASERRLRLRKSISAVLGPLSYVFGVFICAFIVAVSVICFWRWISTTESLSLKRIEIHGNERATDDEIVTLSGLVYGENLLQIDLGLVARRISAHPWISYVEIIPAPPDALKITVTEFEPSAFIELDGIYVVSKDAKVFKRLLPYDELDFPVITGLEREKFRDDPSAARVNIKKALNVISEYSNLGLDKYDKISEVNFSTAGEISIVTAEDASRILLSRTEPLREQLGRLKETFAYLKLWNRSAEKIILDLGRRTDRVALKLKQPIGNEKSGLEKKLSTVLTKENANGAQR
ncbi:MAG: hypothetical protein Kow0090_16550 [Myxococcota bacterium]